MYDFNDRFHIYSFCAGAQYKLEIPSNKESASQQSLHRK